MDSPEILAKLEHLHTDFSVENIGVVCDLVNTYITDYSKSDTDKYLSEERVGFILDNTALLLELPKKFDIRTEKDTFRKQYAKHVSQMCKFIRISHKEYNKLTEKQEEE